MNRLHTTAAALTILALATPGCARDRTLPNQLAPAHEDRVVFKAVQTYSNGKVVRWIDPVTEESPQGAFPTPILELTVPGTWSKDKLNDQAVIQASNRISELYVIVLSESRFSLSRVLPAGN